LIAGVVCNKSLKDFYKDGKMGKLPLLAMILFWNTVIVILVTQTILWRWIRVEVMSLEDNEGSLNLFASGHDPFFSNLKSYCFSGCDVISFILDQIQTKCVNERRDSWFRGGMKI
jgi:hypothetical protein